MAVYAYGYLRGEMGIHRLVRLSPFNAKSLRQTSFASVEVMPVIDNNDTEVIELKPDELRIDTYRASGAGGQNVNKTESAVRVTHLPTGLVAACQSERSQLQNKETAMNMLRSKIVAQHIREQEAAKKEIRGELKSAEWGNQIRSYVLHPYTLVKDHRTGTETSNANQVLEGDLQIFIESELRYLHPR
jgi:peptide chain release factor 2